MDADVELVLSTTKDRGVSSGDIVAIENQHGFAGPC
jgi:hypothetical protein